MASPSATTAIVPPPSPPSTTAAPPNDITQAHSNILQGTEVPRTSTADDGVLPRPRDAGLLHLVLSSLNINSYHERVPLQLLDFAYRYTAGMLSDALRLSADDYSSLPNAPSGKKAAAAAAAAADDGSAVSLASLRQAIASRQGYRFSGPGQVPKEWMLEQAMERNRIALPKVERGWGMRLPDERYCLTGAGWGLKEEWESQGEESADEDEVDGGVDGDAKGDAKGDATEDVGMGGVDGEEDEEGAKEDYEGLFGTDETRDREMGDA
ncbi:hypothetical protein LTR28_008605 [Elasticomyces elasticus]|nr:hypothetical protein LTR28_008605 [Elasticomyces elasticus]